MIRPATPSYRNIDEVPDVTIRERILDSLRRYGSTDEADLIREVARHLGFARAGSKIKAGIGGCSETPVREGKVGRDDGRLEPVTARANVS